MVKFLQPAVQERSDCFQGVLSEILMAKQRSKDESNESQPKNKGNELLIKIRPTLLPHGVTCDQQKHL